MSLTKDMKSHDWNSVANWHTNPWINCQRFRHVAWDDHLCAKDDFENRGRIGRCMFSKLYHNVCSSDESVDQIFCGQAPHCLKLSQNGTNRAAKG